MMLRNIAAMLLLGAASAAAQTEPFDPSKCSCETPDAPAAALFTETVVSVQTDSPLKMNAFAAQQPAQTQPRTAHKKTVYEPPAVSFAWGADLGASIDLTGNDMSAFDFNVLVGMKRGWINFLGAGIGADIAISSSTKAFPLFLAFRTNFRDRPSIVFWDLRGGIAYNQLEHNHEQWGVYGSTGIGVNLARSSKFNSNLSLNYVFRQRKKVVGTEMTHDFTDLHMISVRLGVVF